MTSHPTSSRDLTLSGSHQLPTPPIGVALVIRAAGDPDVSLSDLSRLIEKEPSFTLNLLKIANSAAYSIGRPVKSVSQAMVFLGTRVIRNIAVAHAVSVVSSRMRTGLFDTRAFWEDSVRRGTAAFVLAREAGDESPSEAFTIGLIQDMGVLMLAAIDPPKGVELSAVRMLPAAERIAREHELFGVGHAEVFASVAKQWGLPDDLIDAVSLHHAPSPQVDLRAQRLAEIARAADALADITQTNAAGNTVMNARALIAELSSRTPLELDVLVDLIANEMVVQSRDLDIQVREQPTFEVLMERANATLVRINLSYEELTQKLEAALAEKDRLARQLAATNEALLRLATTDPLTGLGNRRSFADAMAQLTDRLALGGVVVTLIVIDLDGFKRVNDDLGHGAGDSVLAETASRLRQAVRGHDIVARLGGDEFGILLPNCGSDDGRRVAERLRHGLRSQPVRCFDGTVIHVTASFGGVTLEDETCPDDALRFADAALYASKAAGRDRVTWANLVPAPPNASLEASAA